MSPTMAFRHECTCAPDWTGLHHRCKPYLPSIFWGLITIAPAQCKSTSKGASLYAFSCVHSLAPEWVHMNFVGSMAHLMLIFSIV